MSITSLGFIYFLLAVLSIYYLLPRKAQNYWLLFVSYVFCVSWAWQFALVLFVLTFINYYLAHFLTRNRQGRVSLVWVGISLNLLSLVFFRGFNYFIPQFTGLLSSIGIVTPPTDFVILLPIGLSFYSLQNISYLVDVHRGQIQASDDFFNYALYLAYFPKILSGPIERARDFLPRLTNARQVDNAVLARSLSLIAIGATRKLIVADTISGLIFWDAFNDPSLYTAPELIAFVFMYAFFLYNNFAGYTSMARGISGLFGIELSPNFTQPYFSRSFNEFWNNWHITLSHWLRDYIYFPLSRILMRHIPNRHSLINLVLPPVATMLVSGLWHGFSWSMMLWGGLHGLYLVFERISSLRGPVIAPHKKTLWRQAVSGIFVFTLVSFAWVPFATPELPAAFAYWRGMLDWTYQVIRYRRILIFIPLALLVLIFDGLQRREQDEVFLLRWPRLAQASLLASSIFLILILTSIGDEDPFVYQGF
jgi:alginate O-acetyltransferase complex protein AlgI